MKTLSNPQIKKPMRPIHFVFIAFSALLLIAAGLIGCPQYSVYKARLEGDALLAHAQSSKEVVVSEAKAKMESAMYLYQADSIRAVGIAKSNEIIGKSLENNPEYLHWLWIDNLNNDPNMVIYVPTEAGMPIMEATRFINRDLKVPILEREEEEEK